MHEGGDGTPPAGSTAADPRQSSSEARRKASSGDHRSLSVSSLDTGAREAVGRLPRSAIDTSADLADRVDGERRDAAAGVAPAVADRRDAEQLVENEPAQASSSSSNRISHSPSNLSTAREEVATGDDTTTHKQRNEAVASHAGLVIAAEMAKIAVDTTASPPSPSPPPTSQPPKEAASPPPSSSLVTSPPPAATSPSPSSARATTSSALAAPLSFSIPVDTAEAAIRKWKESKDYLKLQRELKRTLSAMDRTSLTDWAAQASLLSQLHKTVQTFKDAVGAVELPDGDHFARSLWRVLSPQNVVGVQRKALEVLQTYVEFVNPAYPMTKDLPLFLPALLELLPQATMQVKSGILGLLDRGVVRRMPPAALRSCALGLFTSLLSCLEESETSPMYRRAMTLLEYMHNTLKYEDAVAATVRAVASTPPCAVAELRGGQVLPAYAWVLIRDAAALRSPALNVMKVFIAQVDTPAAMGGSTRSESGRYSDEPDGAPPSPLAHQHQHQQQQPSQPDWVGGDAKVVVSALLNSLQDTQERTHRLALDVLTLICPLNGGSSGNSNEHAGADTAAAAAAFRYERAVRRSPAPSPSPTAGAPQPSGSSDANGAAALASASIPCPFHSMRANKELFSFEVKSLLVAAAVQLLGTRYGTPSVARRMFQWLTVFPGVDSGDHGHREGGCGPFSPSDRSDEGAMDMAAVDGASTPPSADVYVRDVTSYVLSQGFHMIVQHWRTTWTDRSDDTSDFSGSEQQAARRQVDSELSALQHTARALMYDAAPRLSSAPSIAAAFGGVGSGEGKNNGSSNNTAFSSPATTSAASAALATPLVWLRALLLLFRYRSPALANNRGSDGGEGGGVPVSSPTASDPPQLPALDGAPAADVTFPFLLHVAPLVLPSLSCLLVEVPAVLSMRSHLHYQRSCSFTSSSAGVGGSPEEQMWAAEVREVIRVLPWTYFVQLDVVTIQAVEKLMGPLLTQTPLKTNEETPAAAGSTTDADASSSCSNAMKQRYTEHLQRRVQHYMDQAFALANTLEPSLIDATADQPLAAQEYVRASLHWSNAVTRLLSEVVHALAATLQNSDVDEEGTSRLPLLISTANGLLRLLVQRTQQLMEPMLDGILATATATGTAVVGADFFSSFLSSVDTQVLRQLRQATISGTTSILLNGARAKAFSESQHDVPALSRLSAEGTLPGVYGAEVQRLLSRLHRTTLRFTSFLAQLHLRCQQQAGVGVLLDCASDNGAGARERELARQTAAWLACLCKATADAAVGAAPLFFARAVRLVVDVLLRARGSLLPEPAYRALEPSCPLSGDVAEGVAFAGNFVLAPVVRCLWESCHDKRNETEQLVQSPSAAAAASEPVHASPDTVTTFSESLLVLIAISPACARCLDVYMLQSPMDVAVSRLVGLHRCLTDLRALRRRGRFLSAALPESAALTGLQDPGVLFLGLLSVLDCLSSDAGDVSGFSNTSSSRAFPSPLCDTAESTRQLSRAYVSQTLVRDSPNVLIPLFFSFLCPLVLPTASAVPQRDDGGGGGEGGVGGSGAGGGASSLHRLSAPAFSALSLTVLLPTTQPKRASTTISRLKGESVTQENANDGDEVTMRGPARTYRNLEAPELVRHLCSLLQLPTSREWVQQAMQLPTPNSLRVLLHGLEAQSFMAPEGKADSSGGTSPTARSSAAVASPAREGPSDTLFAATALLLLNLSRQSLLALHWSCMQRRDQASGRRAANASATSESAVRSALPEPTAHRHNFILFDSLACLNRLLELSQTGPRMQPHRTAVLTWQFTSAQFLPLLRLAVQADLHAAQAMLLDHLRGVVLYLDDVTSNASAASSSLSSSMSATVAASGKTAGPPAVIDGAFASRHWRHHALLYVGVAAAGSPHRLLSGASSLQETHRAADICNVNGEDYAGPKGGAQTGALEASSTPVLDDLKRVPPAVVSNKLLYAMIGEVVEHVLGNVWSAQNDARLLDASSCAHEVDTLTCWLRFYCDVMPYLYHDLVSSVEVVADVLLSALEPATLHGTDLPSANALSAVSVRIRCVCYATLIYVVRFLFSVARAADVENYETAVKTKESMSWIASTFSQGDPVTQARNSTMWARSPVLAPIRGSLHRLVFAAVQTLRVCDAPHGTEASINAALHTQHAMWGYDTADEDDVAMGWKGRSLAVKRQQQQQRGEVADLREHACCLLNLLSHSAGPQFLTAFATNWCRTYAAQSSLWMFETAAQRQHRLRQQKEEHQHGGRQPCLNVKNAKETAKQDTPQILVAAWDAKEEAQRAAYVLLEDVGVSVVDVTAALAPLLRDTASMQQRAEQQQQQQGPKTESAGTPSNGDNKRPSSSSASSTALLPPPPVTQLLYFLHQLVEAVCVKRQGGGLTEREAAAIFALMADVVSQWPPEPLSCCCVLHTMYCVVAYAKGEATVAPEPLVTAIKVYQNKDYSFALCRLLEGLSVNPAMTHRSAALMLLQLLCSTFYAMLPASLSAMDNPGRVVDAAIRVFQRTLLPALRRGIASASEAEIISSTPLVNASLQVLRSAICGFAPDLTFAKRVQRDVMALFLSEHFFRYSRSSLHEWALLLRQMYVMDSEFHSLLCERMVQSSGRLSAMMMSRETEALLREHSMKNLAFYTYAVMALEDVVTTTAPTATPSAASTAVATCASAGVSEPTTGPGSTMTAIRQKELAHRIREQLTYTLQHFSSPATPTAAQIEKKEVFLQPLRAAFLVFRVLLMSNVGESLVASLWPLMWPELLRALSIGTQMAPTITATQGEGVGKSAPPMSTEALQEILKLQMEALKVLDVDYTLCPAHAFAFRWLFTDDAALTNLLALQQQQQQRHHRSRRDAENAPHSPSPFVLSLRPSATRRLPFVSHLEVLQLLQQTPPVPSDAHLSIPAVVSAVHEPRGQTAREETDAFRCDGEGVAPVLSTIQHCWPLRARPSAADRGLRRPLYNIPVTHYPRLDGIYRAAQAFTLLLQRVNGDALPLAASSELMDLQRFAWLQAELGQCVGHHNEVDVAYMQDLVEADLTTTDPDTML
ncbi:hypothetical protein ABB37_01418 [Leptomonas pyrrhocoris]|uniref:DOP1 N-terminal domain-containing protein n=1 Tax=Leptomonas pyrrhocoris TaxID=157538 RepID=A0A0N0DZB0_LEPPY|nr:hypothetical protein ABB37_01418 [Leptomonas pyrrhocoris]KPA84982.1 hypothetical protein ABB37_01418 [Leptomonas pyrrhocoris]|eukprot:XP_015663421.1 hypothetical protein ABB37_01418 [Leptomonas pyrrhocoris]